MGDVINLKDYLPHISGIADCCECSYSWACVAPIGVRFFECPNCGSPSATWTEDILPDTYLECECKNHSYAVGCREDGSTFLTCTKCGDNFEIYIEGITGGE